ncbi:MAG TPA: hypothetical protein PLE30_07370 [Candidatus Kapabacteria bacterium]|nr:hypothetical protein [Candidatus Kapabacteria bacterium]
MVRKLVKIGGAFVQSKENFIKLLNLVNSDFYDNSLFVISSFGKSTQRLREIAQNAMYSADKSQALLDNMMKDIHSLSPCEVDLTDEFQQLSRIIKGIFITKELTAKLLDRVLSFGEIISTKLIIENIQIASLHYVPAEELILSDSNYNEAKPIYNASKSKTLEYMKNNLYNKYITQGFIAADINANRTTMGFESSNLTATLLADILNLGEVSIITDVFGLRNFDPKIADNSKLIHNISYNDAMILANYGLKQLYPQMIEIAAKQNIEITFRHFDNNTDITTISSRNSDRTTMLILNSLEYNKTNPDFIYDDKNTVLHFSQSGYKDSSSLINQYILFNIDVVNALKFIIDNFDVHNIYIDTYSNNTLKIISSNDSVSEINKLIHYINQI